MPKAKKKTVKGVKTLADLTLLPGRKKESLEDARLRQQATRAVRIEERNAFDAKVEAKMAELKGGA